MMKIKIKRKKSFLIKRKLKPQDYTNCLKASQFINTVNYLQKKEINLDCLKGDQKTINRKK